MRWLLASLKAKSLNLPGGVDHHHFTRQRVELFGHVAGLGSQQISRKDLRPVGTKVVFVHDFGEGDQVSNVKFSVVVDTLRTRVKVDRNHFGFEEIETIAETTVTNEDLPAPAVPTTKSTGGELLSIPTMHHRSVDPTRNLLCFEARTESSTSRRRTNAWRMVMCSSCVQETVAPERR